MTLRNRVDERIERIDTAILAQPTLPQIISELGNMFAYATIATDATALKIELPATENMKPRIVIWT